MSRSDDLAYLRRSRSAHFEQIKPENDYIVSKDGAPAGMENETYWFSFDIPEKGLCGNVYFWVHSQLRMASSAVIVFRGFKRYYHQAEHFNYQQFLPYPELTADTAALPAMGIRIRIVEPHVRHEISYDDPLTGMSLRLQTRALFAPVGAPGRNHLEQPMHVTGEMVLDGETHRVDCYAMRDRSWRGHRPEASANHPPIVYANGISTDGKMAFNFCGSDDPDRGADWAKDYVVDRSALLLEGWIHRDGELKGAVGMSRIVERDASDFNRILSWECELEDESGRKHLIRAKTQSAMPWAPWYNIFCDWQQFRFDIDGKAEGVGMANESFWGDYARRIRM